MGQTRAISLLMFYFWFATTTKGECQDNNNHCQFWARNKQCEQNPFYMLYNCRRSCNVCRADCADKSAACKNWVNLCHRDVWVINNCRKTCGICRCCPVPPTTATISTEATTNSTAVTKVSSDGLSTGTSASTSGLFTATITASAKVFTGTAKTDHAPGKTEVIISATHTSTAGTTMTPEQRHSTKKANVSLTILAVALAVSTALLCLILLLWVWNRKRKRRCSAAAHSRGDSQTTEPVYRASNKTLTIPTDGSLTRSHMTASDDYSHYLTCGYSVPENVIGRVNPLQDATSVHSEINGENKYFDDNTYEDPKDQVGIRLNMHGKCSGPQEKNQSKNEESTEPSLENGPVYCVLEGPSSSPVDTQTVESTSNYQCLKIDNSSQYQTLRKSENQTEPCTKIT